MSKVKPGDILLFKVVAHSPIHDKIIAMGEWVLHKQFTRSSYCHAALVDFDTEMMFEAVWPKTHLRTIISRHNKIEVFRVKRTTHADRVKAIKWARRHLGVWYSVGQLFFGLFPSRHKLMCSTYVAKAWRAAGFKLGDLSEKIFSPDEIAASPLVKRIK